MTLKEIQNLIKLVSESELSEVKLRDGDFELTIRNSNYAKTKVSSTPFIAAAPAVQAIESPAPAPVAAAPAALAADNAENSDSTAGLVEVKSPIVGTFYRSASPDKPPFVGVGDSISVGSVVCIVEAMKLFNEIESEVSGKIVKVLIEDASPVEYDQPLFLVDPKG